jgi:hypothetical protein
MERVRCGQWGDSGVDNGEIHVWTVERFRCVVRRFRCGQWRDSCVNNGEIQVLTVGRFRCGQWGDSGVDSGVDSGETTDYLV